MIGFILLTVIWLALTGLSDPAEWGMALLAAAVALVLGRRSRVVDVADGRDDAPAVILSVTALVGLLRFVALFFVALVRANIDMARRVLTPALPIDPVVVEIESALVSPLGRLLLANSITLTPGTLTVDSAPGRLQIHWIDGTSLNGCGDTQERLQQATAAIATPFETEIRKFLR